MQIFWEVQQESLLRTTQSWDILGVPQDHFLVGGGHRGGCVHPKSGVYVRGIWVQNANMPGSLMCFAGLDVDGRDRNTVCEQKVVHAVGKLFYYCTNRDQLHTLLAPLRGKSASSKETPTSWLLTGGRRHFLNRLTEKEWYKDFVWHKVFGVPKGALFVSSRTTESTDPFLKWAADFLAKKGTPLHPIEPGADELLFPEVDEHTLKERCFNFLNPDVEDDSDTLVVMDVLEFMTRKSMSKPRFWFSRSVPKVLFHNNHLFVPEAELNRKLLVNIVQTMQPHLVNDDVEMYPFLLEGIFEHLPKLGKLKREEVHETLKRVIEIHEENQQFLLGNTDKCSGGDTPDSPHLDSPSVDPPSVDPPSVDPPSESGTLGGDVRKPAQHNREDPISTVQCPRKKARTDRHQGIRPKKQQSHRELISSLIDQQSAKWGTAKTPPSTIAAGEFPENDAGENSNIPPREELTAISVGEDLGGGSLMCIAEVASVQDHGVLPCDKTSVLCARSWTTPFQSSVVLSHQTFPAN